MGNLVLFLAVVPHFVLQSFSSGSMLISTKQNIEEVKPDVDCASKLLVLDDFIFKNSLEVLDYGFQNVGSVLLYLDRELLKIFIEIEDCADRLDYRSNLEKVQALASQMNNYISDPNKANRDRFTRACKRYSMTSVTRWIYQEITGANLTRPLVMDFNYIDFPSKYFVCSLLVGSTFIKASILGHACLGNIYEGQKYLDEDQEIYRKHVKRNLYSLIDHLWKNLKKKVNEMEMCESVVQHIDWTAIALDDLVVINSTTDPLDQKLVDSVYTNLSNKFYWRRWLVAGWSLGKHAIEYSYYSDIPCDSLQILQHDTLWSVLVASFDPMDSDELEVHFDRCVDEYWFEPRPCGNFCNCSEFVAQYKKCIETTYPMNVPNYNGIICLEHRSDLKVRGDGRGWNSAPGFKQYSIPLVKVEGGFKTTNPRPGEEYTIKDVILTSWKCQHWDIKSVYF